jgi:hypothetical protein
MWSITVHMRSITVHMRSLTVHMRSITVHMRSIIVHMWSITVHTGQCGLSLVSFHEGCRECKVTHANWCVISSFVMGIVLDMFFGYGFVMILVLDMVHGYQSQWMGLITAHDGYGYGTWLSISMDGIDNCSLWLWMWYMVINFNGWD